MHLARSEHQFDFLAEFGRQLMTAHQELEAWEWFSGQYLQAPYNGWWVGASEEMGVSPNNNDLESYWRYVLHIVVEC